MTSFPRPSLAAVALLAAALVMRPALADAAADAAASVEALHATLVSVMRDAKALGFEGRRARLDPVIRARFDLAAISRFVLGPYWRGLSDADRARMVEAFSKLTVATYASRFDGYDGERFETVGERPLRHDRELVRTVLVKSDGGKVKLDYLLQRSGDAWRIVNVVADGVSDLALKQAEYQTIMKGGGIDALVAKLDEQTAEYAAKSK